VILTLALLALAAWVFMRWVGKRLGSELRPAPARSLQGWDYRMRLRTLDDESIEASLFRDRTLFLNFWATWCAPCVAELPSIARLVQRLEGTDVAFACVTTEPLSRVKAFAERRALKLPIYVLVDEPPAIFQTQAIPATFVVRNGDVISQHIGAARWDTDDMVALLTGAPVEASSRLRSRWEVRLPAIEPPWTHWRLLGVNDGETFIADIPAEDVAAAVRTVTANHRSFRKVVAELVRFGDDGCCILSKQQVVICSRNDRAS
jgi:thiol-disulfide isomerase/thioredoxin